MKGDEESIRRTLGLYGTVENVAFRHWPHLPNVSDGVRVVPMVRREAIPRYHSTGDFQVKICYAGQQQVCDLCAPPWPYCAGVPPEGQMLPVRARGSPLPKLPP